MNAKINKVLGISAIDDDIFDALQERNKKFGYIKKKKKKARISPNLQKPNENDQSMQDFEALTQKQKDTESQLNAQQDYIRELKQQQSDHENEINIQLQEKERELEHEREENRNLQERLNSVNKQIAEAIADSAGNGSNAQQMKDLFQKQLDDGQIRVKELEEENDSLKQIEIYSGFRNEFQLQSKNQSYDKDNEGEEELKEGDIILVGQGYLDVHELAIKHDPYKKTVDIISVDGKKQKIAEVYMTFESYLPFPRCLYSYKISQPSQLQSEYPSDSKTPIQVDKNEKVKDDSFSQKSIPPQRSQTNIMTPSFDASRNGIAKSRSISPYSPYSSIDYRNGLTQIQKKT
ncbi:MAG: hypothetical protein EZS28_011050 [Streblomastix strix]|uniref:Uncharacterized protein n=1 Tax=Streblomastix strix TaxID=222440 RepID=A0A5J4WFY0_9EUKA|nr:MAG: hypothetical protein EZS28_011050 [Streblomastix strix]